jgi:hypothetical protein
MKHVIWKFPLNIRETENVIMMPENAQVVHVAVQDNTQLCLWALCDPLAEKEERVFYVRETGTEFPGVDYYLGTAYMGKYSYVVHVFER